MITMSQLLFLLYYLLTTIESNQIVAPVTLELAASIDALNLGLESETNLIYTEPAQPLEVYEQITNTRNQVPSVLINGKLNSLASICTHLPEPLLVIMPQVDLRRTLLIFEQFPIKWQESDFLIVGTDQADSWLQLLAALWQLGYPNIIIFNCTERVTLLHSSLVQGLLYTSASYRHQELKSCTIAQYIYDRRHWFDNLKGLEVRVAVYNNPPRCLVYPEKQLFDGYALMMLRQFLAYRGAKFVPVLTPNYTGYSPNDCYAFLRHNQCDICGDLFAYNGHLTQEFSYTASYAYLYINVLIPAPQPLSKNFYIVAPLQVKCWLLLLTSLVVVLSFSSFVCWLQNGRLELGKLLLEILCSLLSAGFQLRDIVGRLHYILFSTIFVAGFIYCNYYLAFMKTILSTGLYGPQIDSFEQLVKQNISLVIGDYDKTVLMTYDFPDILWNITRVVPYEFIVAHRRVFDINYAYLAHSDRLVLFKFQQQYMAKPRMYPLPIDMSHSLPGFPMQPSWLLKYKLSETLLNCFSSGLIQKLATDTNMQTIHIGYLPIIPSEQYEAIPLTLDYFMVSLIMLTVGVALAFVCLLAELFCDLIKRAK